uniref:U3 small nucleolar ribonucleoprotein protein MPP10 n=1 Tax=Cacopsylla melanoneura TaxID=428564 RepID=A0A8D8R3L7_9HEMI
MTVKANAPESVIDNICTKFEDITSKPVKFLTVQNGLTDSMKCTVKDIYDLTKTFEDTKDKPQKGNATLKKLIINKLDEEQIWQQIEIQNAFKNMEFLRQTSVILNANEKQSSITFPFKFQDEEDEEEEEVVEEEEEENEDDEEEREGEEKDNEYDDLEEDEDDKGDEPSDHEDLKPSKGNFRAVKPGSIVDDTFFKLDELDRYLEMEDKKEMKQNKQRGGDEDEEEEASELIDYFEDDDRESEDEDSENEGIKFGDFFRGPEEELEEKKKQKKKLRFENLADNEDDEEFDENELEELNEDEEEDNEEELENIEETADSEEEEENQTSSHKQIKSSYEARQDRLKSRIQTLEEDLVSEKPWQMKGEVSATKRPQNSLLEEVVEFDLTTRPAPEITEETTLKLEDIIRQRIKDKAFDDVERKIKPVDTPQEFRKKLVLDQEKSKLSLAQIYEQEYLKQAESTTANPLDEKPEEVPKEHEEIKKMMDHLFRQLDALSNFHYTPKMVLPEVRIVNNTPAIEMEEVAPVASTDATLLAPEEVKSKHKGELMAKEERTDTDKKRERRKKKINQKLKHKKREEKEKMSELMKPGIGKKFNKEKMKKTLETVTKSKNVQKMVDTGNTKAVKSSTAFFNQLQDEVKATIKRKTSGGGTKKKSEHSAKKLKL